MEEKKSTTKKSLAITIYCFLSFLFITIILLITTGIQSIGSIFMIFLTVVTFVCSSFSLFQFFNKKKAENKTTEKEAPSTRKILKTEKEKSKKTTLFFLICFVIAILVWLFIKYFVGIEIRYFSIISCTIILLGFSFISYLNYTFFKRLEKMEEEDEKRNS